MTVNIQRLKPYKERTEEDEETDEEADVETIPEEIGAMYPLIKKVCFNDQEERYSDSEWETLPETDQSKTQEPESGSPNQTMSTDQSEIETVLDIANLPQDSNSGSPNPLVSVDESGPRQSSPLKFNPPPLDFITPPSTIHEQSTLRDVSSPSKVERTKRLCEIETIPSEQPIRKIKSVSKPIQEELPPKSIMKPAKTTSSKISSSSRPSLSRPSSPRPLSPRPVSPRPLSPKTSSSRPPSSRPTSSRPTSSKSSSSRPSREQSPSCSMALLILTSLILQTSANFNVVNPIIWRPSDRDVTVMEGEIIARLYLNNTCPIIGNKLDLKGNNLISFNTWCNQEFEQNIMQPIKENCGYKNILGTKKKREVIIILTITAALFAGLGALGLAVHNLLQIQNIKEVSLILVNNQKTAQEAINRLEKH